MDIHGTYTCATNIDWSKVVPGSKPGVTYTVRWCFQPYPHETQYDWQCTCPSFSFGKGKPCKHILAVKGERCGWNAVLDLVSEMPRDAEGEPCCPECGGPVQAMRVGV